MHFHCTIDYSLPCNIRILLLGYSEDHDYGNSNRNIKALKLKINEKFNTPQNPSWPSFHLCISAVQTTTNKTGQPRGLLPASPENPKGGVAGYLNRAIGTNGRQKKGEESLNSSPI